MERAPNLKTPPMFNWFPLYNEGSLIEYTVHAGLHPAVHQAIRSSKYLELTVQTAHLDPALENKLRQTVLALPALQDKTFSLHIRLQTGPLPQVHPMSKRAIFKNP
jgi:hypothetical protein